MIYVDSPENRICSQVQLISDCKQADPHSYTYPTKVLENGEERSLHEVRSLNSKWKLSTPQQYLKKIRFADMILRNESL